MAAPPYSHKPQTRHVKLSGLAQFAKWLMRQEAPRGGYLLDSNPLDRIERPRKLKPERKFLHRDELAAFVAVESRRHEAIARTLLLATALRASELCRLNVDDLRDGALRVRLKGGRMRTIVLPPDVSKRWRHGSAPATPAARTRFW